MTSEMLNKILKVEEEVAAAELTARVKAEEIVKQAKLKADTIIAKAQQQARDNTTAVMLQTDQRAAEIKKAATDAAKAEGSVMISDARKKQAEAIKVIKDHLLPNSGI